ncbi:Hypothetical protein SCF082_LOCUS1324 [Durusdinium trenchii]|uniref:HEAT repeat domain-containing protein n=1 Tax=Durusdinium trenchii TaxID=1381693 RepID=A0ABP0HDI2_9DINO
MSLGKHLTDVFRYGARKHCRGFSSEPVLSQLSRVISKSGTEGLQEFQASHPDAAEQRRDALRRLGAQAEKDPSHRAEAISEALDAMKDPHPLVRLAGLHTLARVCPVGSQHWRDAADLSGDADELLRVGALRAVGRMAEPGDPEALEFLQRAEKDATDRNVRGAARDAHARLLGRFGALPGGGQASMLE